MIHYDELEQIKRHQLHSRIERLGFSHYENPNSLQSTAFIANNLIFGQKILGHDSEKTTLIYLSTLDTSAVDNANSEILAALWEW